MWVHTVKEPAQTFKIVFADNQPILDQTFAQILVEFPGYGTAITPTKIQVASKTLLGVLQVFADANRSSQEPVPAADKPGNHGEVNTFRRTRDKAIADNQKALEILSAADFETRQLTGEERLILENYAGAGGQYTDDATSKHNEDALTQFYTPAFAGERMYEIAYSLGFPKDGKILEPSCGVGRLIKPAPNYSNVTAFEVSEIPFRIARKLYPSATIYNQYFEQAFLQQPRYNTLLKGGSSWLPAFDLVIGNPPYGKHTNLYQSYFGKPNFGQIEQFFMYYGLKLLKPGGLLMYVTNSSFMRTGGAYQVAKEHIFSIGTFEGAYWMPNQFMELTDVSSDILIFRKK